MESYMINMIFMKVRNKKNNSNKVRAIENIFVLDPVK